MNNQDRIRNQGLSLLCQLIEGIEGEIEGAPVTDDAPYSTTFEGYVDSGVLSVLPIEPSPDTLPGTSFFESFSEG